MREKCVYIKGVFVFNVPEMETIYKDIKEQDVFHINCVEESTQLRHTHVLKALMSLKELGYVKHLGSDIYQTIPYMERRRKYGNSNGTGNQRHQ